MSDKQYVVVITWPWGDADPSPWPYGPFDHQPTAKELTAIRNSFMEDTSTSEGDWFGCGCEMTVSLLVPIPEGGR